MIFLKRYYFIIRLKICKANLPCLFFYTRKITAQDGTVINDGSRELTVDEILRMNWLCDNVEGSIPKFDEILPISRAMVRELGIYRDEIPAEKEAPV